MKKIIKIEMMDYMGEWGEEEFEMNKSGITPWDYSKNLNKIGSKNENPFDNILDIASLYLPRVIGKKRFLIDGMEDGLKFKEVLEEFFINDPQALDEVINEMGFFLAPALKKRLSK